MGKGDGKRGNLAETLGRYKYVMLVAALGTVLLLWPRQESAAAGKEMSSDPNEWNYVQELEKKMEEILSRVNGVGRVDVLLTLESGEELILASDSTLSYRGSPQNPDNYERSSETVTVSGGGGTEVVVTQERSAKYRGALIVCDGGDNDAVRLRVVEAVCALTGLGADRVVVVRWGSGEHDSNTTFGSREDLS